MSALRSACTLLLVVLLGAVFLSPASCPQHPQRLHGSAAAQPHAGAAAAAPPPPAAPAAPAECYPANPAACEGACKALLEKILHERNKSSWLEYYNDVTAEIFRRGVSEGTIVEVGTAYGGLAHHILATHPKIRVIAVDPFFGDYDAGDSMSTYFRGLREEYGQDKFSALWAQAMAYEAGRNFGCRYSLYNTYSEKAAARFPRRSIDMMCVGLGWGGVEGCSSSRRLQRPSTAEAPLAPSSHPLHLPPSPPPPSPRARSFIDGDHTREGVEKDIRAWAPILKLGRMMLFNDYQIQHWPGVVQAVDALAERTAQSVYKLPQESWGNVGLFNLPELFQEPSD